MASAAGDVELDVLLLGPVEARLGGRVLPLGRGKLPALLALLALEPNRVVSTDRVVDSLWSDDPPPSAAVALYGLVSQLRRLIEPADAAVVTRAPGYVLELPPERTDLGRFEMLVEAGRAELARHDAKEASARLCGALSLWRGPPLQDLEPFEFARAAAAHLEEARLAALQDRIAADLERGLTRELIGELQSLVAAHPLREGLRAQLMLALYRAGRQADALAVYRDTRAALDELGLEPSQELQALERAILRHEAEPAPAEPAVEVAGTGGGGRRRTWVAAAAAAVVAAAVITPLLATGRSSHTVRPLATSAIGTIAHGRLVAADAFPSPPSDVAVGAGSLWVTSTDDQTVSRVDLRTNAVTQTIRVGAGASGIAADDRGVWVANALAGTVSRIDPRTNTVVQTIPVAAGPVAVALVHGTVWIASSDEQTLSVVDARTGRRLGSIPLGASPRALVFGAGSLWVVDAKRGVVYRVDPARRSVLDTITVGNGPAAIAYGHGSVWVANNLDGTVSRIDAGSDAIRATVPVGDGPRAIAVARDAVWVANEYGGTVAGVDTRRNTVVRRVRAGGRPQGLASVGDRLFVTARSAGSEHIGGTLRLTGTPPQHVSVDTVNLYALAQTLLTNDGLVGFRRTGGIEGNQLVPDLAIAVPKPTDGGRAYVFRLRPGIRYSTGRPVRAEDFPHAFERAARSSRPTCTCSTTPRSRACRHAARTRRTATSRTESLPTRRPEPSRSASAGPIPTSS